MRRGRTRKGPSGITFQNHLRVADDVRSHHLLAYCALTPTLTLTLTLALALTQVLLFNYWANETSPETKNTPNIGR